MITPTLESLEARIEALERIVHSKGHTPRELPRIIPGTGNWDRFLNLAKELSKTFDFDAIRENDELEWRIARERAT